MSDTEGAPSQEPATSSDALPAKKPKRNYRREKPWDTDDIDHWKIEPFTPEDSSGAPFEESSFAVLFPQYREKYLKDVWPAVTAALEKYGIKCELNLIEGSMTVRTTKKTWDPYMILNARDLIKLLARSVPVQQALKILNDDVFCDIIKIGKIVRNRERFVKRRQRLVGPEGATLKALELLTECYILVQGNTVSAMGSPKGLKNVRRVVLDCMNNIHPVYNLKTLMIKRELMKDPMLQNENWDRFLPQFKKRNIKRKKPQKEKKKKDKALFPPEQLPRKVDIQMETGEYFLTKQQVAQREAEERSKRESDKRAQRVEERAKRFIAPEEGTGEKKSEQKRNDVDVSGTVEKLKRKAKEASDADKQRKKTRKAANGEQKAMKKEKATSESSSKADKKEKKKKKKKDKRKESD